MVAVVAVSLWVGAATVPAGSPVVFETGPPSARVSNVRLPKGLAARAVEQAVVGAARRLEDRECQKVLSDFRNTDGRLLSDAVSATGLSAAQYLGLVLFYDGSQERACRPWRSFAVTYSGSRVVYICSRQFLRKQRRNAPGAEAIIIHEMLHSLGLGENPPASEHVTRRVEKRCRSANGQDGHSLIR